MQHCKNRYEQRDAYVAKRQVQLEEQETQQLKKKTKADLNKELSNGF